MSVERLPFWSDDFDMDLLRVVPGVETTLGDMAGTVLYTHGGTSHGRLNHPSVWNSAIGMVAYFGLRETAKPAHCWTNHPVVACTWEEVVRDAWAHNLIVVVERSVIYDTSDYDPFQRLMGHVRGEHLLPTSEVERITSDALCRIRYSTNLLRAIVRRAWAKEVSHVG